MIIAHLSVNMVSCRHSVLVQLRKSIVCELLLLLVCRTVKLQVVYFMVATEVPFKLDIRGLAILHCTWCRIDDNICMSHLHECSDSEMITHQVDNTMVLAKWISPNACDLVVTIRNMCIRMACVRIIAQTFVIIEYMGNN